MIARLLLALLLPLVWLVIGYTIEYFYPSYGKMKNKKKGRKWTQQQK